MIATVDIPQDSAYARRYRRLIHLARRHQATSIVRRWSYGQSGHTFVVASATLDDDLLRRYVLN